ncbi:unnamed protein product [Chrysoparadoxa australica]
MPRRGRKRKKTRTHALAPPDGALTEERPPQSFVFKKGKVKLHVSELVEEMRRMMEPHTARNLKERKKNAVKDLAAVAGPLGVSHLHYFTQTDSSLSYRIARCPDGPTLTFRVNQYTLARCVRSIHKRPVDVTHAFKTPPLVVLNNFGGTNQPSHFKLLKVTLQNVFPAINVATVKLAQCRRIVLFNLNKTGEVEMRHYAINAVPQGMTRAIKKVVQARVPNLHSLSDISEYVEGYGVGAASDSEVDDEDAKLELSDRYVGRGNVKSQKSAIKLQEIGPRLTLQLTKVERGLAGGEVLYHAFVTKTREEILMTKQRIDLAETLKRKRREEQEANVERKKAEAEEKREKKRLAREAGRP